MDEVAGGRFLLHAIDDGLGQRLVVATAPVYDYVCSSCRGRDDVVTVKVSDHESGPLGQEVLHTLFFRLVAKEDRPFVVGVRCCDRASASIADPTSHPNSVELTQRLASLFRPISRESLRKYLDHIESCSGGVY